MWVRIGSFVQRTSADRLSACVIALAALATALLAGSIAPSNADAIQFPPGLGKAIERAVDQVVEDHANEMAAFTDQTETELFQVGSENRCAFLLADIARDAEEELKDQKDSALQAIDNLIATSKAHLGPLCNARSGCANMLDHIGDRGKQKITREFDGDIDWIELTRHDAQVTLCQNKDVLVEIVIVFQYKGSKFNANTDEAFEDTADKLERRLKEDGKKTVRKDVNKDNDLNQVLVDAAKEAKKIGKVHSIETLGHGTSDGGLQVPKGNNGGYVLGGKDMAFTVDNDDTLGRFLGTIRGIILEPGKESYVRYNACFSDTGGEESKEGLVIVPLTAGLTGILTKGFTGGCLFPGASHPVSAKDGREQAEDPQKNGEVVDKAFEGKKKDQKAIKDKIKETEENVKKELK